MDYDMNYENNL